MRLPDIVLSHRPWVNKKSYTDEVVRCDCGRKMHSTDDQSWAEWAAHIEEIANVYRRPNRSIKRSPTPKEPGVA